MNIYSSLVYNSEISIFIADVTDYKGKLGKRIKGSLFRKIFYKFRIKKFPIGVSVCKANFALTLNNSRTVNYIAGGDITVAFASYVAFRTA